MAETLTFWKMKCRTNRLSEEAPTGCAYRSQEAAIEAAEKWLRQVGPEHFTTVSETRRVRPGSLAIDVSESCVIMHWLMERRSCTPMEKTDTKVIDGKEYVWREEYKEYGPWVMDLASSFASALPCSKHMITIEIDETTLRWSTEEGLTDGERRHPGGRRGRPPGGRS